MPKHVSVPDSMIEACKIDKESGYLQGFQKQQFLPPDETRGEDIKTAETLVTLSSEGVPVIRLFFKLSNEEIKQIQGGAVLEVSQWGDHLHPLGLEVRV